MNRRDVITGLLLAGALIALILALHHRGQVSDPSEIGALQGRTEAVQSGEIDGGISKSGPSDIPDGFRSPPIPSHPGTLEPEASEATRDLQESNGREEADLRAPVAGADLELEDRKQRDFLVALFDVNEDTRPDLVVFEKKDLEVSQILLGGEKGDFEAAPTRIQVPEYFTRFLALAAENGPEEGLLSVMTDRGEERTVVLLGKK